MKFVIIYFFFFNDTATTEIYTLSLHDALPISTRASASVQAPKGYHNDLQDCRQYRSGVGTERASPTRDRKSTRLNSSHANISYAVFCLKKKKNKHTYIYSLSVYHLPPASITIN